MAEMGRKPLNRSWSFRQRIGTPCADTGKTAAATIEDKATALEFVRVVPAILARQPSPCADARARTGFSVELPTPGFRREPSNYGVSGPKRGIDSTVNGSFASWLIFEIMNFVELLSYGIHDLMHYSLHGRINTMPGLQNDDGADRAPADRPTAQNLVFQMPALRQVWTTRRGLRYGNSYTAAHKYRRLIPVYLPFRKKQMRDRSRAWGLDETIFRSHEAGLKRTSGQIPWIKQRGAIMSAIINAIYRDFIRASLSGAKVAGGWAGNWPFAEFATAAGVWTAAVMCRSI
jgi:hypothetical protein